MEKNAYMIENLQNQIDRLRLSLKATDSKYATNEINTIILLNLKKIEELKKEG